MQLNFDFIDEKKSDNYPQEDFVVTKENQKAFKFLHAFFVQKKFINALFKSAIILGERHCGKTHLLHIFYQRDVDNIHFLKEENLSGVNLSNLFLPNQFYILENIQNITDKKLLLHIINCANDQSSFLILTANQNLKNIGHSISDLNSRIKNILSIEIENPSKKLIKILLTKNFAKKQLMLDNKIINFIANSLDKSYQSIIDITKFIELFCFENHKTVTLSNISKLLKNSGLNEKR